MTHDPLTTCPVLAVRLKREYGLHELRLALDNGRTRLEAVNCGVNRGSSLHSPTVWPCRGLLLFPGHAAPLLPLEPAHQWKKEWSKSQAREYYYNKSTGQSIWSEHRKSRPLSFRSTAAAMIRWDRRSTAPSEVQLLELAAEIPPR